MYVIIWRYRVDPAKLSEYKAAYNSEGEWVSLFRNFDGFIRTELLQDLDKNEYMTLDYWTGVDSYDRYKSESKAEFQELDDRCEEFTVEETFIGAFELERTDARW